MAVARLVSLFENKSLDPSFIPSHHDSFASRSLRPSPIMSSEDTFHITINPHHFVHKCASRQRYYESNSSSAVSSPISSPSSSYRGRLRSASPMSSSSSPYTPTRRRFSQHLRLRRIPSLVDLALAAERDERGLELLEPRPVGIVDVGAPGRSASSPVMLDGIFEVLEGVL